MFVLFERSEGLIAMHNLRLARTVVVWALMSTAAVAQSADKKLTAAGFDGEVTGTDVYVRSGPSTNYYEVAKLNAGDRIHIVRENHDWYAIRAPQGCFSLIHKNFVDVDASGKKGVVNGDAVLVRAGSSLRPDLYAKQTKLNRGAVVTIIQPHNDDYLRIAPPAGALFYVHSRYITKVKTNHLATSPPKTTPAALTGTLTDDDAKKADRKNAGDASPPQGDKHTDLEPGKYRDELAVLDAAVDEEDQKPLLQRDYGALIDRFKPLTEQDVDTYAHAYAVARIAQFERAAASAHAVRSLRDISGRIATKRKNALRVRNEIQAPDREIGGGFDAIGVLRPSVLFRSAAGPRWYRLVADDTSTLRTIGYVEIPDDLHLDPAAYLGRKVGVRARERRVLTGDVDPLEVFVVAELVVLDAVDAQHALRPDTEVNR